MASAGERQARLLRPVHVIANGGNADAGDVTWVHYVHGAHEPQVAGFRRRVLARFAHAYYARRERAALGRARLVLCNSKRTAQDVHERIGIEAARTRVVYYGSDASQFSLVSDAGANRFAGASLAGRSIVLWRSSSARWAIGARGSTVSSKPGRFCAATRRGTRIWP